MEKNLKSPTLDETRAWITELFAGVFDKSGDLYVNHCFRVEQGLGTEATEDERHAALLHDVVEDTSITYEDLFRRGFSERTIELIIFLTFDDPNLTYMDQIRTIAFTKDKGLINIK